MVEPENTDSRTQAADPIVGLPARDVHASTLSVEEVALIGRAVFRRHRGDRPVPAAESGPGACPPLARPGGRPTRRLHGTDGTPRGCRVARRLQVSAAPSATQVGATVRLRRKPYDEHVGVHDLHRTEVRRVAGPALPEPG